MNVQEMQRRRNKALDYLDKAIETLGPISDETPGIIREPILDIVEGIYEWGTELKLILFKRPD